MKYLKNRKCYLLILLSLISICLISIRSYDQDSGKSISFGTVTFPEKIKVKFTIATGMPPGANISDIWEFTESEYIKGVLSQEMLKVWHDEMDDFMGIGITLPSSDAG